MQNLVCRTDAIFHQRDGFIEAFPEYWVIRTPDNPSFWFGNYILFKNAPQPGDLPRWRKIHDQVFGQSLNHMVMGWDEPAPGSIQQFLDVKLVPSHGIALSLDAPPAPMPINPDLEIRALVEQSEWDAMLRQQIKIDRDDFAYPEDAGEFRSKQMAASQRMAAEGHGNWWGAFLNDELVGGMGLYFDDAQSIGRFQYVTTAAAHRRKRVCTTILDHAVRHAFATVKPETLVISTDADDDNPAIPTYRNFGFRDAMRSYAFRQAGPDDRP